MQDGFINSISRFLDTLRPHFIPGTNFSVLISVPGEPESSLLVSSSSSYRELIEALEHLEREHKRGILEELDS